VLVSVLFSELIGVLLSAVFGILSTALLDGLRIGLIGSMISAAFGGWVIWSKSEIKMAEVLTWSWKNLRENLVATLPIRLFFGLLIGLFFCVFFGALIGLASGLKAGLFGMLVGVLASRPFFELSSKQLIKRVHLAPNEGTWRSVKNGLLIGIGFGLVIGPLIGLVVGLLFLLIGGSRVGLVGGLLFGVLSGLFFELIFGLVIGLLFGLSAFFQHFVLRFWLWRTNALPWNLVVFLDDMAKRLLLYKAGGSYLFVHRLLLEYLGSLEMPLFVEKKTTDVPASVEGE
jgi:hypothetical protein